MICLLDANVLLSLFLETHMHHQRADLWFSKFSGEFATCSVTQGALLRLHMRFAEDSSAERAWQSLDQIVSHPKHQYWNDGFGYHELSPHAIQGHRQVTDAWLVELAKRQDGKVATFDKGMAANHVDHTYIIPE